MMAMRKNDNPEGTAVGAAARTVLVLGMGVTGASCARHFAKRGASAWFADTRAEPPGLAAIRDAMPNAGVLAGRIPDTVPAGVTDVVVSPGVELGLPLIADAKRRGIEVRSDLDVFVEHASAPVVGITGSNGKSTVTSMAGAMLASSGWRAGVGGNLGTPALDLLDAGARAYVLELSSFQLERSGPLALAAAVVLNVAPDHLDRHGDMAAYTAAKARVYASCRTAVVNRDEPALASLVPAGTPTVSFGLDVPRTGSLGMLEADGRDWLAFGSERLLPADELGTTGRHNVSNALAALALVGALGVAPSACVAALRDFRGLPHRMQVVHRAGGVTWIDDSKATNVAAAVTSIRGVGDPLVLVAGGDGKGQSFDELAAALSGRDAVALLVGRDREPISRALAGRCRAELVDSMAEAVGRARELARPGATVLLAPACSSLDMFANYEERGRVFAAEARGGRS